MKEHEKQRNVACKAVSALRKAMRLTQTEFAVDVLRMAVSTVARLETSTPPQPDVLLRLAGIANREAASSKDKDEQQVFTGLRDTFRGLYVESEVLGKGFDLALYSLSDRTCGYLTLLLGNSDEVRAADDFLRVVMGLRSADPVHMRAAATALTALRKAADKLLDIDGYSIAILGLGDSQQPVHLFKGDRQ